jgi:hypothetical protein
MAGEREMNATKEISPWQFTMFRIVFGIYLAWHFAALIPFGAELFSNEGVLPKASQNLTYRAFPNLLAILDSPSQVRAILGGLVLISTFLTSGCCW